MSKNALLPAISPDGNLSRYLTQIRQFPMLEAEEEYGLATAWKERGDVEAAHQLVTSHLRLVAKIAMGYRGYGLPVWIKAAIQEYILRSWSLVKIGTTSAQKKLFFNLRRLKNKIQDVDQGHLQPDQVTTIAETLNVSEAEVISMDQRMAGHDHSLNATVKGDGEQMTEWQDWLEDSTPDQETTFAEAEEFDARKNLMVEAMQALNEREQRIIHARRLSEPPLTLEELAKEFSVSRERVRQIEVRAFEKLADGVRKKAEERNLLPLEN